MKTNNGYNLSDFSVDIFESGMVLGAPGRSPGVLAHQERSGLPEGPHQQLHQEPY